MLKVMLVEDDNNLREIYEARLKAEGYTIVSAKDGEEALVVAKAEKPDLIISDVMMPKISGFEMLDILRNTDGLRDTPVIMLTALGQSEDQTRADKLGANRYLVKSQVTLEDIVRVSHELLNDAPAATPATPDPISAAPTTPAPAAAPTPEPPAAPSSTQEEASVEAQIEDFIAGASTTPTAAPAAPAPEPAAPPAADNTAADAQLVDDAVAALVQDTEKPDPVPAPAAEPTIQPLSSSSSLPDNSTPPEGPADTPSGAPATPPAPENENAADAPVKIANKKVIIPLESEPKKDITELLAAEEAKEAVGAPPAPPTAVIDNGTGQAQAQPLAPTPTAAPAPTEFAAQNDTPPPADPNSVAL